MILNKLLSAGTLADSTPAPPPAPASGSATFLSVCALIAFVGGGVKAILHRDARTTWKDVAAAAVSSSLAGFAVGSLLRYLWGPEKDLLIFPAVAIAGWLGVVLLDWAASVALRRIKEEAKGGGEGEKR